MKIFIEKLILEGVHGVTAKEKRRPQPFRVDISAEVEGPEGNDEIDNTFDYRTMKRVATKVVEESHNLLETLAVKIARELFCNDRVLSVTVTVRKIAIWDSGVPGVTVCYRR